MEASKALERETYTKEHFSVLCFAELVFVVSAQTSRDFALNPTQFQKRARLVLPKAAGFKYALVCFQPLGKGRNSDSPVAFRVSQSLSCYSGASHFPTRVFSKLPLSLYLCLPLSFGLSPFLSYREDSKRICPNSGFIETGGHFGLYANASATKLFKACSGKKNGIVVVHLQKPTSTPPSHHLSGSRINEKLDPTP